MKDLTFLTSSLIAHRGLHSDAVGENTLLAFEKAIAKGYIIEFDLHLTLDKEVVVYHDNNLKRLTGINKDIKDLTYEELKKITLKTGEHIPKFSETLKVIDGKVPILIELKTDNKCGVLENEVVKYLDNYKGKFAIQSFNPLSLYWFKKHRKNYIRGQLVTLEYNFNFITNLLCKHMILNPIVKPDFISMNVKRLPDPNIRNKYILIGWTIRNEKDLKKYKNCCDNLICEKIL